MTAKVALPSGIESGIGQNSTITPLNNAAVFTGQWERNFEQDVLVSCKTDQSGVLQMQFSPDGTNVDSSLSFKVSAASNEIHKLVKGPRYYRTVFTNDSGSNQTYLRLYTYYGQFSILTSPVNGTISQDADALIVRPTDFFQTVAEGKVANTFNVVKFGRNSDVDAAEDMWEGGGDYTGFPTGSPETVNVVSTSTDDDSAGTGARTLRFVGLKTATSTDYESEDITLNGTTAVTSANTWYRINRAYVLTAGSGGENAGIITISHTTTTANVFAAIPVGSNQTQIAAYTIPYGNTGYIKRVRCAGARATGTTIVDISLRTRDPGSVFRSQALYTVGNAIVADVNYLTGIVVSAMADLKLRVEGVSATNADVIGEIEMIVEKS